MLQGKAVSALSSKQQLVLSFIVAYFLRYDRIPSMPAISEHFGFKSANTSFEYMTKLEDKGYLEKVDHFYRFSRSWHGRPVATENRSMPVLAAKPARKRCKACKWETDPGDPTGRTHICTVCKTQTPF